MIQVSNLWKSYDRLIAVREFDLEIESSQTVGLIGPNGSGKTTLLRMITTMAKPDSGSIHVCGHDALLDPRSVRRKIAFMPAEFGFPQEASIKEYMEFFACAAGVPRRERARTVDEVMELTDLKGREEVFIRGLSTGNKQRVLLAKTLLSDPEILVLDEPSSGLDPRARAEVRALLKELASMGKTILISSHILADIEDICSHICIIEQGRRITAGPIDELRADFRSVHKIVHLKLKEADIDKAIGLLSQLEEVVKCGREGSVVYLNSLQENSNFVLKALIESDIEILGMSEELPDLEDIFLETTKGVVS
jgi:ABC-2 type transport system ATP-binding protein